jgi:hypothetical protein
VTCKQHRTDSTVTCKQHRKAPNHAFILSGAASHRYLRAAWPTAATCRTQRRVKREAPCSRASTNSNPAPLCSPAHRTPQAVTSTRSIVMLPQREQNRPAPAAPRHVAGPADDDTAAAAAACLSTRKHAEHLSTQRLSRVTCRPSRATRRSPICVRCTHRPIVQTSPHSLGSSIGAT